MEFWTVLLGLLVGAGLICASAAAGYQLGLARGRSASEHDRIQLAQIKSARIADEEKLQWLQNAEATLKESFSALASRSLVTTSDELLKRAKEQTETLLGQIRGDLATNRASLQGLVDPLRTNLDALGQHVRDLEQKREGAYRSLEEQTRELARTHSSLQATTLTLAQALKSHTTRGRWGEVQLRRVVELANMVSHVDFEEQPTTGDAGRPDMIVHLSNGGVLPVDSKVPLSAYLEAVESCDEDCRRAKLAEHAGAMQGRVRELGNKRYWDQFERSPDFVVMFVPNESCLSAAFETDPDLLDFAIGLHVLIASPVTLLALLKAVSYGWQQAQITESARTIAQQGRELYTRMSSFIDHLAALGKSINKTAEEFNRTLGSLEHRLLPSAKRLEQSGLSMEELALPEPVEIRAIPPTRSED